jgi:hypothetical protein
MRHSILVGFLGCGVLIASIGWSVGDAMGVEIKSPQLEDPRPDYKKDAIDHASEISDLLTRALQADAPTATRVKAITELTVLNYDSLLANAAPLIADTDPDVSLTTVSVLGGQIAMLPSGHAAHGGTPTEQEKYQQDIVQATLAALRTALDVAPPEARNKAASILSSRGDVEGLKGIQSLIDEGKMEPVQGLAYISLAPNELGSAYTEKYLVSPNPAVQSAAVSQLSYDPAYTEKVRELALDKETPKEVTTAALPGLAATDKTFLEYGPALAQDSSVANEVRMQAIESTVQFTMTNNTPSSKVLELAPALSEAATELKSGKAIQSVQGLKQNYGIQ